MSDLTPEQTEDFLSLWERAIELSDPNRRDAMEAERAGIWTAETQSRRLARSILSDLQRNANVETNAGRELAEACAALRRTLDPACVNKCGGTAAFCLGCYERAAKHVGDLTAANIVLREGAPK